MEKRARRVGLLLLAALLLPCGARGADSGGSLDDLALIYPRGDLFVTASRSARTLDRAPAIATVVTARQIHDMGARNLLDVLATVPGFGVGFPPLAAVWEAVDVRGIQTTLTEKVLLMIDGHPVRTPLFAAWTVDLDALPVDAIDRVEIIRGPGSALYGANAVLAVINVIMRRPGELEGTRLTLGGGNAARWHENVLLSHQAGAGAFVAMYDHLDTSGTRDFIRRDDAGNSGQTHDWQSNDYAFGAARYHHLTLEGMLVNRDRGSPLSLRDRVDTRTELRQRHAYGTLGWADRVGGADLQVDLGVDQVWGDYRWQLDIPGYADLANPRSVDRTSSGALRLRAAPTAGHEVLLGASVDDVRQFDVRQFLDGVDVSATANFNRDAQRTVVALFGQDEWDLGHGAVLTTGLRWDRYSDFGATLNPRAALVLAPWDDVTAKLLYGRAFRAPSFTELYNVNNPVVVGDPNLKPEIMQTLEAGAEWHPGFVYRVRGNTYFNHFYRRIVLGTPTVNAAGAHVWGTELELRADWRERRYGYLNWSWNTSEDEITGARLPDVPRHRVKAGLNWGLFREHLNANVEARWRGRQTRAPGDNRPFTEAVTVVDLALRMDRIAPGVSLGLSVHNLFDRTYADPTGSNVPDGYPRPGRTWLVEGSYRY